jgi:hypothetical protein
LSIRKQKAREKSCSLKNRGKSLRKFFVNFGLSPWISYEILAIRKVVIRIGDVLHVVQHLPSKVKAKFKPQLHQKENVVIESSTLGIRNILYLRK